MEGVQSSTAYLTNYHQIECLRLHIHRLYQRLYPNATERVSTEKELEEINIYFDLLDDFRDHEILHWPKDSLSRQ
jgi:hypothetical protein